MKAATVIQLKKELETLNEEHLRQLCLRLARFKIENKELLTYLLFESEIELLLYYCHKLKNLKPSISNNVTLTNIYLKQIESIEKKIIKLHEDLQYDFRERLNDLNE